ncbi:uncharacterized protein TRAVEDRAFT_41560 [Trametes versicolor FP-101664 SS1]|uniref:uncharacterized protein n=1 Tax=Trametes versicolor (strain FP-101664) TaxID=717944 RepID=UPI0004622FE1|nr:uncharacterized protein TRAVEDRAFT_41560 [Trametes versicolor FP-101664 SS1]EIW64144.1 hypothetical protein TRAVEDRAFT_41560 [Trametes versicolor FP-101664 SS1]
MFSSFLDRVGKYQFHPAQPMWGYLPQVNQWGSTALEWEVERIGGKDHIPIFKAIPVYEGERLEVFAGVGDSKKAAKEKAAEQMALSGHCVRRSIWVVL